MTKHAAATILFDKIDARISEFAGQLAEVAEKHGPEVIDLGLNVVRLTGAAYLTAGFVLIIIIPFLVWSGIYWTRKYNAASYGTEDWYLWGAIPSIVLAVSATMAVPILLLNFWNWVAVFYPAAYLAKKVMGL